MNTKKLLLAGMALATLTACGIYVRIGDLNGIAIRI
jgi:hypothetical protein